MNSTTQRWSQFIPNRPAPSRGADGACVLGVLEGEGVGPEVIRASLKVLAAVAATLNRKFDIRIAERTGAAVEPGGAAAFCARTFSEGGAVLAGPVGGRFVYDTRKRFDLFCKISPLQPRAELRGAGRLKPEWVCNADLLVVRENASGVYQGQWQEAVGPDGGRRAEHRFSYTESEVRRILEPASRIARHRRGEMTVVVKQAGVPAISALWRDCAAEIAPSAGVKLSVLDVDYAAYRFIQHAHDMDVVVAPNMFGDILSDLGGVLLGSRALTYSGNFAAGVAAIYQTNHGAAHDLAGSDKANPVGQMFALAMLLRESFGDLEAADLIEAAVHSVWRQGWRTADLAEPGCRLAGTQQMGDLVAAAVRQLRPGS
jgi:3-isopropylmalate dehydrogenase